MPAAQKLPQKILNYFATFTETRFNYRRLINYRWSNDEHTLDLSLFPEFENKVLNLIKSGAIHDFSITPKEFTLKISKQELLAEILHSLQATCTPQLLQKFISEETESNKVDTQLIKQETKTPEIIWPNSVRRFNLQVRKELEVCIIKLQEKLLTEYKEEYGVASFPPTSFGMNNYLKAHFDALQILAKKEVTPSEYLTKVEAYFKKSLEDLILYDLFYNLGAYAAFIPMGTLYLFFHRIGTETSSYPLYFIEVDLRFSNNEILLSFSRDLLLLNTPAINLFKYERVLTIPRATPIRQAENHLVAIENFLQSQYGHHQPFILEPNFREIISDNEEYPSISGRIGFQIVANEDKKLLDYSEIMTNLDQGGQSRFNDFVGNYIKGTVPNNQEEVDTVFQRDYPLVSPKRYIADGPIPLNTSQRRILLALANPKNKMIVVDGPPGTGKSHTIAALAYQANDEEKAVVITSHKKEALDVIDRMMTDKFKSLHPQAKPSIVRIDKETGSTNTFLNTLQNSVVSAASTRAIEYNGSAIEQDAMKLAERLEATISSRIAEAEHSLEMVESQIAFTKVHETLLQEADVSTIVSTLPKLIDTLNFEILQKFIHSVSSPIFSSTSLREFEFVVKHKEQLSEFLTACQHMNDSPADTQSLETKLPIITEEIRSLLLRIKKHFKPTAPLASLSTKNAAAGLFSKISGKTAREKQLQEIIRESKSLQYSSALTEIVRLSGKSVDSANVADLTIGLERAEAAIALREYKNWIDEYRAIDGNEGLSIPDMYAEVSRYREHIELFSVETLDAMRTLFRHYGSLLTSIGVTEHEISSLNRLVTGDQKEKTILEWIQLHAKLSQANTGGDDFTYTAEQYSRLKQKQLENKNDLRLKELNQHLGVMQQLRVSYEGGKRFTKEQTAVLLRAVSVVIAEPATLSRYFPMEEDLIDVLIIDEASQVSIADSISLILRAKQVVIFGDEFQYGAVSAINVSSKYSASYFTEIVNAYADDYQIAVSEQAREEVVRETAKELKEDEMVSDALLRPQDNPGAVLWLKTFNIRTSTLTFAKAIANYSTSLREHFRSFPEIISYSNEVFYKPAQQELIINRIRTKPIGETLVFLRVTSKGKAGQNTNLDEIDAIISDIQARIQKGFQGTIGIIVSFKEQQARLEEALNERTNLQQLRKDHKLANWFVGDVQGEERDIVYYSFVEDESIQNADLRNIYPVIGGTADSTRSLKMQRLNVGFSRAKDTMVFVHSQDIEKFSTTRLGDALKHYQRVLEESEKNDFFVADESVFGSPKEKELYQQLLNTEFVKTHKANIRIVPQFPIGKYLKAEFAAQIPDYRADFLLVLSESGKERTLILEYDGLEYHFKDTSEVSRYSSSREFIDYDISRQLELESYGYKFLRINAFTLRPEKKGDTPIIVLDRLLSSKFRGTH